MAFANGDQQAERLEPEREKGSSIGAVLKEYDSVVNGLREKQGGSFETVRDGRYKLLSVHFVRDERKLLRCESGNEDKLRLCLLLENEGGIAFLIKAVNKELGHIEFELAPAIGKTINVINGYMAPDGGAYVNRGNDDQNPDYYFVYRELSKRREELFESLGVPELARLTPDRKYRITYAKALTEVDERTQSKKYFVMVGFQLQPREGENPGNMPTVIMKVYFEEEALLEMWRTHRFFSAIKGIVTPKHSLPAILKTSRVNDLFNAVGRAPLMTSGDVYVLDDVTRAGSGVTLFYHNLADHNVFVSNYESVRGELTKEEIEGEVSRAFRKREDTGARAEIAFHTYMLHITTLPDSDKRPYFKDRRLSQIHDYFRANREDYSDREHVTVFSVSEDVHDHALDYMRVPQGGSYMNEPPRFDFKRIRVADSAAERVQKIIDTTINKELGAIK
jgi:hypothetical protein